MKTSTTKSILLLTQNRFPRRGRNVSIRVIACFPSLHTVLNLSCKMRKRNTGQKLETETEIFYVFLFFWLIMFIMLFIE